jgi:hypothetical protein
MLKGRSEEEFRCRTAGACEGFFELDSISSTPRGWKVSISAEEPLSGVLELQG